MNNPLGQMGDIQDSPGFELDMVHSAGVDRQLLDEVD